MDFAPLTADEYLAGELESDIKHADVDDRVYAMEANIKYKTSADRSLGRYGSRRPVGRD